MGQEELHGVAQSRRIETLERQVADLRAEVAAIRKADGTHFGAQAAALLSNLAGHPLFVLAASVGAGLAFAALVILDRELTGGSDRHTFYLIYMVPIAVPFTAFLLDRAKTWLFAPTAHWEAYLPLAVDLPVVVLGAARALINVPFISGHALFLAYALLTMRSRTGRVLAMIVLAEVIYLKIFVWNDTTLYGGVLVATVAALLFHFLNRRNLAHRLTH